jgi:hypothetical protein
MGSQLFVTLSASASVGMHFYNASMHQGIPTQCGEENHSLAVILFATLRRVVLMRDCIVMHANLHWCAGSGCYAFVRLCFYG